jgi:5-methylcytosine-specific restriction protein A
MGIRDVLKDIADTYVAAKAEAFTGNPVAAYLRQDAPQAVSEALSESHFRVVGSPGQGNWAEVPWIAVFDPNVTTTATSGQYVVYVFSADFTQAFLTLAQGTTAIREEFGSGTHDELRRRATLIRARLPERRTRFTDAPVKLGGSTTLARDYEPSVAFGISYELGNLPPELSLVEDLRQMVRLYLMLTARGGVDSIDVGATGEQSNGQAATIVERRRYRLHRKIERDSKAAKAAKKAHGHICQGCGFDFRAIYGDLGKDYIEAHHLTPLSQLPEDVPVQQDPKLDFAVLCANCHRMVHRKGAPTDIKQISEFTGVVRLRRFLGGL